MILDGTAPKGDVFACARIAGIMAAKRTAELIPMCHPIPIESVDIAIEAVSETQVRVVSTLRCSHKTGIEMEALTAASVAALTIYDMCKAVDRGMRIDETLLLHKTGGQKRRLSRGRSGGTMTLLEQLQAAAENARKGLPAALTIDADGVQYTRNFMPQERLILLGGGTIAQPLCRYAADLGFELVVADDRPSFANHPRFPEAKQIVCDLFPAAIEKIGIRESDYVAVITRGHRYDADCLRELLRGIMPRYLGMIGSKRRTVGLLNMLEEEGFSRADLDRIHTPIGLDIGALTVKEIAISIVAELIAERRRTTDRRSKSSILTAEDIDLPLLETAARGDIPKTLMLVYETSGSTPVKSGSYMVVDANTATAGTIGGGCSESAVMRQAYYLIGTGEHKCVTIDMSNDIAAQEGMVCGGQMKVLLADLGTKKST